MSASNVSVPNSAVKRQSYFRRSCLIACWLLGLSLTTSAWSSVQTITSGNSLILSCQQTLFALDQGLESLPDSERNAPFLCLAYLSGIMAASQHANELAKLRFAQATKGSGDTQQFNLYCIDWQLSYQRVARIVVEYAKRHPGLGKRPAQELVMRALESAYPCRK